MRFQAQHSLDGPPGAVAAVLADPRFYLELDLPDLSRPILIDQRVEAQRSVLTLRYEFVGSLDRVGRRLVGGRRLAWIQQIDIDCSTCDGRLVFKAEADPGRLHGTAHFEIVADGDGSSRSLSGELVVAVPVVGARAERHIVPGLVRRLDIEANYLNERLRS